MSKVLTSLPVGERAGLVSSGGLDTSVKDLPNGRGGSWATEVNTSELDVEEIVDVIVAAFHEEATRHVELDKLKIMHIGIPERRLRRGLGEPARGVAGAAQDAGLIVFDERGVRPGRPAEPRPGPPAPVIGEPDPTPEAERVRIDRRGAGGRRHGSHD